MLLLGYIIHLIILNIINNLFEVIMFISAQILSITAGALIAISFLLKNKDIIMLLNLLSSLIFALSYYFLNSFVGVSISVIMAVLVFCTYLILKFSKNKQRDLTICSSILTCIAIILGVILWESWHSVLPIIAVVILGFGYTTKNLKIVRVCILIEIAIHIVFNIFIRSYGGVAVQGLILIYGLIVFILNNHIEETKPVNPIEILFHIDSNLVYSITSHETIKEKDKEELQSSKEKDKEDK